MASLGDLARLAAKTGMSLRKEQGKTAQLTERALDTANRMTTYMSVVGKYQPGQTIGPEDAARLKGIMTTVQPKPKFQTTEIRPKTDSIVPLAPVEAGPD